MVWITAGLTAAAVLAALPAVVIAAQVALATVPFARKRRGAGSDPLQSNQGESLVRPTAAMLVPAHNEALGIRATIESLFAQTSQGDRIVVIADNCTDATAQIAHECG